MSSSQTWKNSLPQTTRPIYIRRGGGPVVARTVSICYPDFAEIAKLLWMVLAIPASLLAPQKPLPKPRPSTPPPEPSLIQDLLRLLLGAPPLTPPENSPRYDRRGLSYPTLPNALPTLPPEPPATPQERERPLPAHSVLLSSNLDPALTDALSSPPSAPPQSGMRRHRRAPVVPPAIAEIEVAAPTKPPRRRRRRIPKPMLQPETLQAEQARVTQEALGSPPSAPPSAGTRRHRRTPVVPPAIAEIEVAAPTKPPRRRRRRIPKPTLQPEKSASGTGPRCPRGSRFTSVGSTVGGNASAPPHPCRSARDCRDRGFGADQTSTSSTSAYPETDASARKSASGTGPRCQRGSRFTSVGSTVGGNASAPPHPCRSARDCRDRGFGADQTSTSSTSAYPETDASARKSAGGTGPRCQSGKQFANRSGHTRAEGTATDATPARSSGCHPRNHHPAHTG